MIRFTWRQFRLQTLMALAALIIVAAVALATRPGLAETFATASTTTPRLSGAYVALRGALILIAMATPLLVGVFWGAPLVSRELETGTFRLGWTQTVTRRRWLAGKLLVAGLCSIALSGLFSLIVTWWSAPMFGANLAGETAPNRFGLLLFSAGGLVPLGYGAFGFALGVTAGLVLRRMLAAMAVTFTGFAAVRLIITYWVRPHFMPPAQTSLSLTRSMIGGFTRSADGVIHMTAAAHIPNAWIYSTTVVDSAGHQVTAEALKNAAADNLAAVMDRLAASYHALVTYQPAGRFWAFQGIETAVFLALAVILAGLCFWWVGRRIS